MIRGGLRSRLRASASGGAPGALLFRSRRTGLRIRPRPGKAKRTGPAHPCPAPRGRPPNCSKPGPTPSAFRGGPGDRSPETLRSPIDQPWSDGQTIRAPKSGTGRSGASVAALSNLLVSVGGFCPRLVRANPPVGQGAALPRMRKRHGGRSQVFPADAIRAGSTSGSGPAPLWKRQPAPAQVGRGPLVRRMPEGSRFYTGMPGFPYSGNPSGGANNAPPCTVFNDPARIAVPGPNRRDGVRPVRTPGAGGGVQ